MSFFEFPHTRTYDSDLGWLINKYDELSGYEKDAAASAESAAESANAAAESASAAAASAANAEASEQYVVNRTAVLDARLSEAISGLTPTDSELQDIRVWYDGQTSETAGDAVRGQMELADKIPAVVVGPANFLQQIPDFDSLRKNTTYRLVVTSAMYTNAAWADVFPEQFKTGQGVYLLTQYGDMTQNSTTQIMIRCNDGAYLVRHRYYNAGTDSQVWSAWAGTAPVFTVQKSGGRNFTSLTEAVHIAGHFEGAYIHVYPGNYDIIEEFEAYYGSTFFDDFDGSRSFRRGLILANGMTVFCEAGVNITCEYTGENDAVTRYFSPINTGAGSGCTLIGAKVTDRNVRYTVHDELSPSTIPYHNVFKNCEFIHDKGTGNGFYQTIGGGLGSFGQIEIENCRIVSTNSTLEQIVSYHNVETNVGRSNIYIKDNWIGGSIRFSWYGSSTDISKMYVCGNRLTSEPITSSESGASTVNVEIIKWNNTIE